MFKRKYLGKYKYKYMLPENDDFLCFVDNLFWYHKKHLKLRELLKQHEPFLMTNPEGFVKRVREYKLAEKQTEVNVNIRAFFMLVIIELYKRIEEDNVFCWILDESISMEWYYYHRVYRWKVKRWEENYNIDRISKQIRHFRDACVHKEDDKISTNPEFVEHGIEWWNMYLPFTTDWENNEWCFLIWRWKLPFHRLEQIIEYTLNYYYPMSERTKKRIKQWEKEYKNKLKR